MSVSVLFVCLGNICRSPTAEAVFTHVVKKACLTDKVVIDSAGTAAYHVGKSPDMRARDAAKKRGYEMSHLIGRQISDKDFESFDYVLAMDTANFNDLLERCPDAYRSKVKLFLSYGSCSESEVPDPYYGGHSGFLTVLDLIEDASQGLLAAITNKADEV